MSHELRSLIDEAVRLTGSELPDVATDGAPVLAESVLNAADGAARGDDSDGGVYFIGVIGGKDVGKSSFVNALVGEPIAVPTDTGRGTTTVLAYCHAARSAEVRKLLEGLVPGRFELVTHHHDHLRRQVLLDLPDIDSVYADHVELTRRMLRHILYPVWIQSIEKYADHAPRELLRRVVEGNAPENLLFCLNKADQLARVESEAAVRALADDFAMRVAPLLGTARPPRVFVISAREPDRFDFPGLRAQLGSQKPESTVRDDLRNARRTRESSILRWLENLHTGRRLEAASRAEAETRAVVEERILRPLVTRALPAAGQDPGLRSILTDEVLRARLRGWPIVGVLDMALWPITQLVSRNLATHPWPHTASARIRSEVEREGKTLPEFVAAGFAQARALEPRLSELFSRDRPWEPEPATRHAAHLERELAQLSLDQLEDLKAKYSGAPWKLLFPLRWLLTIGAVLWFPLVQPVTELLLQESPATSLRSATLLTVQLLSSTYLLKTAAFLLVWFLVLWAWLRYSTHKFVVRRLRDWFTEQESPDGLNAAQLVSEWLDRMLEPVSREREALESLQLRIEQLRRSTAGPVNGS
jgi:hypothetical protein